MGKLNVVHSNNETLFHHKNNGYLYNKCFMHSWVFNILRIAVVPIFFQCHQLSQIVSILLFISHILMTPMIAYTEF